MATTLTCSRRDQTVRIPFTVTDVKRILFLNGYSPFASARNFREPTRNAFLRLNYYPWECATVWLTETSNTLVVFVEFVIINDH